jgi:hypothetical protein
VTDDIHPLDAYRRMLVGAEDGAESAWWYLGTTIASPDGFEEIVVNHVETVMVYRAQSLGPDAFRVPWWEIGLFRDAITGEIASDWTNPLTGAPLKAARQFEEGPSGYSLRRGAVGGIEMFDAVQAFAILDRATIEARRVGDKLCITQTELKTRSFPDPDGRIPDVSEGKAVRSRTVLQFLADIADLASDAPSVPASGMYSFELAAPAWLGFGDMPVSFAIRGLMHKAAMQEPLNPRGWADLQLLYPQYFAEGRLQPQWG